MRKLVFVIFSAALMVGLNNCSSGDDGNVNSLTFQYEPEARKAFNDSSINCDEPGNDCPSFSGAMFSYTEFREAHPIWGYMRDMFSVSYCTQQLISNNRVITNRHCLPDDLQFAGANCQGRLYFKFPNTNEFGAETAHCRSVVALTSNADYKDEDTFGTDWAILQLETPVRRTPGDVSLEGFQQRQPVHLYPSYFTRGHTYMSNGGRVPIGVGNIRRVDCEVRRDNISGDLNYHRYAPLFKAACDGRMVGGNSGTTVLSSSGSIIGVHSHSQGEESEEAVYEDSPRILDRSTEGTNLHCVSYFNPTPSDTCYYNTEQRSLLRSLSFFVSVGEAALSTSDTYRDQVIEENNSQLYVRYGAVSEEYLDFELAHSSVRFTRQLPSSLINQTLRETFRQLAHHFPVCVERSAPDNFSSEYSVPDFDIPNMRHDYQANLILDFEGTDKTMFEYTRVGGMYRIELARAEEDVRSLFRSQLRTLRSHKQECDDAGRYSRERLCNRYNETKNELEVWRANQETESSVLDNEEAIFNSNDETYEELIPICGDS